jgi:hypothetical protein
MMEELVKLYHLLEEKYPYAKRELIWNYNRLQNYIQNQTPTNLIFKNAIKTTFLFLKNPDKFTISEPCYIDCEQLKGLRIPLMQHIPNLNQINLKDLEYFDNVQLIGKKDKIIGIWDGSHRITIHTALLAPIKSVIIKSHYYNDHPNNKEIKEIANSLYKKLFLK